MVHQWHVVETTGLCKLSLWRILQIQQSNAHIYDMLQAHKADVEELPNIIMNASPSRPGRQWQQSEGRKPCCQPIWVLQQTEDRIRV